MARVGAQDSGCVRIQQHATAYFAPSRVTAQPKRCCQTTVADPAKVTLKRRGVWGLANAVHIMQKVPDGSAPLADSGQLFLFWRALFPPSAGCPRLRLGGGRVRVGRWPLYVPCIDAGEKGVRDNSNNYGRNTADQKRPTSTEFLAYPAYDRSTNRRRPKPSHGPQRHHPAPHGRCADSCSADLTTALKEMLP